MKIYNKGIILLFTTILFTCFSSKADHFLGARMEASFNASDSVLSVRVFAFRDCNGGTIGSPSINVNIGTALFKTITPILVSTKDITPEVGGCTRCSSSSCTTFIYGMQQIEYFGKVKLKLKTKSSISLDYYECCRSSALTNGGSWDGFYWNLKMNGIGDKNQSSPKYRSSPILIYPKNQALSLDLGAFDDDVENGFKDSSVYFLSKAMASSGTGITYNSKFSFLRPFTYSGFPKAYPKSSYSNPSSTNGLIFDSLTGTLSTVSTKKEIFVVSATVETWSKDAKGIKFKKGESKQDFIVLSIDVPKSNGYCYLTGIDSIAYQIDSALYCEGKNSDHYVVGINGGTSKDSSRISVKTDAKNLKYKIDSTSSIYPKLTFNWSPDSIDIKEGMKQLVVTIKSKNATGLVVPYTRVYKLIPRKLPVLSKLVSYTIGCNNDIKFDYSGSGATQWFFGDGDSALNYSINHNYKLNSKYNPFITSLNICGFIDTFKLGTLSTKNPVKAKILINRTSACKGDSINVADTNSLSTLKYSWSFGYLRFTLSNKSMILRFANNAIYTFKLKLIDSLSGCSDSTKISILQDDSCVYPGDCNYDKIVDNIDLLYIGAGFGKIGVPRPNANIKYNNQPCLNWKDTFTNNINFKHADCNGDSSINYSDTNAIVSNYGSKHLKSLVINQSDSTYVPLKVNILNGNKSIKYTDTIYFEVNLGSKQISAQKIIGAAFDLLLTKTDFTYLDFNFNNNFLDASGNNLLAKSFVDFSKFGNHIPITIVNTNQNIVYGFGTILRGKAVLKSPVNKLSTGYFSINFSNNYLMDGTSKFNKHHLIGDSILIDDRATIINNIIIDQSNSIKAYPNPFSDHLNIEFISVENRIITLQDLEGRIIFNINSNSLNINCSNYVKSLSSGIYLLKVRNRDNSTNVIRIEKRD